MGRNVKCLVTTLPTKIVCLALALGLTYLPNFGQAKESTLGGFPIREPGASRPSSSSSQTQGNKASSCKDNKSATHCLVVPMNLQGGPDHMEVGCISQRKLQIYARYETEIKKSLVGCRQNSQSPWESGKSCENIAQKDGWDLGITIALPRLHPGKTFSFLIENLSFAPPSESRPGEINLFPDNSSNCEGRYFIGVIKDSFDFQ